MQHALAVEVTLAKVRLVLGIVSAASVVPLHLGSNEHILLAMATLNLYAVAAAAALQLRWIRQPWHITTLHAADVAGTILATWHSGGATSPYSTIYLFTLLAAGYRWGRVEVWMTCACGASAMTLQALFASAFDWDPEPDPPLVVLRIAYLALGGALIGYMAGMEQRQRRRAVTGARILRLVHKHSSAGTAVHALVDGLLDVFEAGRVVMTVDEDGRDSVTVWRGVAAGDEGGRRTVTMGAEPRANAAAFVFPIPREVDALLVTRAGTPRRPAPGATVVAIGRDGQDVGVQVPIAPLLDQPPSWHRALVLTYTEVAGMSTRLFLLLPRSVRASRLDLIDLQATMHEAGAAVANLYLQRRLQSRSAVVERTRISRELHDGVIQGLIGAEMQLEVTRRQAEGIIPESFTGELKQIQRIIGQEVLNVRDLMHMLKPMDVDASRLVEHLASLVDQFRQRTGIKATFSCGVDDIDLSPRICREVAGIVQEALANVRKHSEATQVMLRLDSRDGSWSVTVDDNGKGLDFEGYLSHEEIESQRKGPVLIKERVRSIRGRLGIYSHPGFGTKLEITIPRKHHA